MSIRKKSIICYLLIGLFVNFPFSLVVATELSDMHKRQLVKRDIENYFDALSRGDVTLISALLTGRSVNARKKIIHRENYGARLREAFGNARFHVVEIKLQAPNEAIVHVEIRLSTGEVQSPWFFMRLTNDQGRYAYRIYDEKAINEL